MESVRDALSSTTSDARAVPAATVSLGQTTAYCVRSAHIVHNATCNKHSCSCKCYALNTVVPSNDDHMMTGIEIAVVVR